MVSHYVLSLKVLAEQYFPDRHRPVVELGSGHGVMTRALADLGYGRIVAIDVDPWAVGLASEVAGTEALQLDAATDTWPMESDSAQAVLIFHVIEHMWDPDQMLAEARRVLEPSGHVVVVTPNFAKQFKRFYEDRTHIHPYVAVSLEAAVGAADFQVVRLTGFNVHAPLGRLPWVWQRFPQLLFTGDALLCIGKKPAEAA